MGNDNILMVVVLAVVAYFILMPAKALAELEHKITKGTFGTGTIPCTRGDLYRSTKKDICEPGYEATTWFGLTDCKCISGIFAPVQSPQTPAPTPTKCPYDPNLLYGDSRCIALYPQYPPSEGSISGSELCNPSSPYYVGDAVANAPGGCYG